MRPSASRRGPPPESLLTHLTGEAVGIKATQATILSPSTDRTIPRQRDVEEKMVLWNSQ